MKKVLALLALTVRMYGQTATALTAPPDLQFFDANGRVLSSGAVYTYTAGTSTPLATYSDYTLSTPNPNPIILNSAGKPPNGIWLGPYQYKFIVKNSAATTIRTMDYVSDIGLVLKANLAASTGASLIGYTPPGASAATTVKLYLDAGILWDYATFATNTWAGACAAAAAQVKVLGVQKVQAVSGNYTCTAPILFTNGAYLVPASGVTATFTVEGWNGQKICDVSSGGTCNITSTSGVVSPRMWGAVGNGSTNDSAAWTACAAGTGSNVIDGENLAYALTTAVPFSRSNQTVQNVRWVVNRAAPPVTNSYESSAFYISGDVNQANLKFLNMAFTGTNYWSGIGTVDLYTTNGWDGGIAPNINTLMYTTTRKNITFDKMSFANPYYAAIFVSNVQSHISNIDVEGCANTSDVGCLTSRFAEGISFHRIHMKGVLYGKNINSSNANGVTMSDIHIQGTGNYQLCFYAGDFNQDTSISNVSCNLATTAGYDTSPFKGSYYAQRTSVTGMIAKGAGYVLFQGTKGGSFTGNWIASSGVRTFQTYYHNSFAPQEDADSLNISGNVFLNCVADNCVTADEATNVPLTVDLGFCTRCKFSANTVYGNVVANEARDINITDNKIFFADARVTPAVALELTTFSSANVSGNKIQSSYTLTATVLFTNSATTAGASTFSGNTFSQPTGGAYAVTVTGYVGGSFDYFGNKPINAIPGNAFEFLNTVAATNTVYERKNGELPGSVRYMCWKVDGTLGYGTAAEINAATCN